MLVNLVANAIKFTDRGGVLIDVRLVERHEDRVRLRFEVHDSGIGIAYVDQPHVFERFTQSGGEPARRRGGTGLGLSIARELVELMAGSIGLVSSPGGGSSFWFELPLALDEPRARRSHLPRDARLLVIGDERGLEPLLQHFAGGPPRVERIADMAALPAILRESDVPTALLVAGGGPQADAASLADRITEMRLNEPVDVLTFARHPIAMPTHTLADLSPIGATREILERCLAHAFARAGSEDEEGDAELVAEHADDHGAPRLDAKRSARLLLAEDNKTNQRVLARILEQAGHEVAVVADGRQALDRLERDRFDVVLLDVNMPVMGGFDAIKMLRFTHDLSELPPIVALTADATRETRDAALELGFSAYLTKPVDSRQMLAAIDRLTAASAPTHEAHPTAPAMVSPARPPPAEWSGPVRPRAQVIPLAPRVAAETPSPLDEARVASLVALDAGDGFFAKVVEDYLADAASLIAALQMDAAAGKAGAFRDSAHALKSSSAHVGATALFERCLGWRNLDDHALMLRARAELADLQRDFDSVRRALLERREQAADGRITSTTRPGRRQDGSH